MEGIGRRGMVGKVLPLWIGESIYPGGFENRKHTFSRAHDLLGGMEGMDGTRLEMPVKGA